MRSFRISNHARDRYNERRVKGEYPATIEVALQKGEYKGLITGRTKIVAYKELVFLIDDKNNVVKTCLPYGAFIKLKRERKIR